MTTIRAYSLDVLVWLAALALACLFWAWAAAVFTIEDFTDTGVGGGNACVKPMIQGEAETTTAKAAP